MRTLTVFNSVTLDGYFTGKDGDLRWAHAGSDDPEFQKFTAENAKGDGTLLFGRKTYEMMASHWPTPAAAEASPVVAEFMNEAPKVVFSRTLDRASWSNTRLVKGDPPEEVRRLKKEPGGDLVVMGSGTIVSRLASEGLVDQYQLVLTPVVLGEGRTMFEGLEKTLAFRLTKSRAFRNGRVFLSYAPAD